MFDTSKSNKSNNSDGNSKHSSATSTMHSNDSGCATMYSSSMVCNQDHISSKTSPRPVTIGPEYINMGESEKEYINLFACKTSGNSSLISGKREPPPPPPPPKRKLQINLSLRQLHYQIFQIITLHNYFIETSMQGSWNII